MLLGLKTDNPVAELYLYDEAGKLLAERQWRADRQLAHGLLAEIDAFLVLHDCRLQSLGGLFAYEGPGSFTGLRIGLTVINTLAYALRVPVVGQAADTDWRETAVKRLRSGDNDRVVMPFYGVDARITLPRK